MNDKAWNDPPLFSLDQMSRAGGQAHRRNRYPQQPAANQPNPIVQTNPMNQTNPMMATNPQTMGINYGQNQPMMMSDSNGYNNYNPNPQVAATNKPFEVNFDANAFVYAIQMCLTSNPNIPQEIHQKWHNIQSHLYNTNLEPQTKATLQSLSTSIQSQDINSARFYCNTLLNDSNQIVRTMASVVSEIFRYFG